MCCNASNAPVQVASLFKPSSKRANAETSTTQSAPQAGGQPLSYAEFVVQSKSRAKEQSGQGPHTGDLPRDVLRAAGQRSEIAVESRSVTKPPTDAGKTWTSTRGRESPEPAGAGSENSAVAEGLQEEDLAQGQKTNEGERTEERTVMPPAMGSGSSIIVSPRQVQKHSICQGPTVKMCLKKKVLLRFKNYLMHVQCKNLTVHIHV